MAVRPNVGLSWSDKVLLNIEGDDLGFRSKACAPLHRITLFGFRKYAPFTF